MMRTALVRAIVPVAFIITALPFVLNAQQPRGYYAGTIGSGNAVMLKIDPIDDTNMGSYCYQNVGSRLGLAGKIAPDGTFTLEESDEQAKRTGTITGRTSVNGDTVRGEWRNMAGTKRLPLVAVRVGTVDSIQGSRRLGIYNAVFTARFPVFLARPGVPVSAVNGSIRAAVTSEEQRTYEALRELAADDPGPDTGAPEYQFGTYVTLDPALYNDRLVTLTGFYEYIGGAHPSYLYPNINLLLNGGTVRTVLPTDVFGTSVAYRSRIGTMLFDALKRSGYPCMDQLDRAMMMDTAYTDAFLVAGKGLLYRLWPGPHACGPARDIVIPYAKIQGILSRSGITVDRK